MNLYIEITILAFLFAVFLGWLIWVQKPEIVSYENGMVCKESKGKKQYLSINELSVIKFSYHAVIGFVGVWEFTGNSGRVVCVSSETKGISEVLRSLETELPGFSLKEFERKLEEGDVEDSLDVWQRS